MPNSVSVDCIVRRRSGGPVMLVQAISCEGPGGRLIALCEWTDVEGHAEVSVPVDELTSLTRF
jgi:uncharacterized protein YodC (DUF2158 family)